MPAASFKCVLLAPCSRCLSAPPRAPTIFLASRSFAILSLAVAIISLTTISFVPYAQQIDFYFTAHSSGYSLYVHGARSLTLRTRHPSPDHSLHPYPHTDHLCPIFHPSRCPFALRIYQPLELRWSWLELAAALLARQSHGWRDGESAQRPRWPIPRLNGACSGLLGRVVAWYVCP